MFCRRCGNEIPDDSVFCLKCGIKVEDVDNQSEVSQAAMEENQENENAIVDTESIEKHNDEIVDTDKMEDSTSTAVESKPKYLLWICIISVVFLIIAVASSKANKCKLDSCDKEKQKGSEYCYYHSCGYEGCTYSKSKSSTYCIIHEQERTCTYNGCKNSKVNGGEYCSVHTCNELGCYKQAGYSSSYCSDHQVDMTKKLGNEFSFSVNSAGGIELNFRARNISTKEIKYIRFDVEFRNAVGDKIQDEITDKNAVSVEVVGPIASGKSAQFNDIIGYNDNCTRIDIKEVTLIYTDGTSLTGSYGWYVEK
ncbi:zinc-ribbon domain [Clostridium sp. ASBs410]|nr:zinc-ribbon domain [Clostridium sp. ASBs410]